VGQLDAFDKPPPYLQALETLAAIVHRIDMRRMFLDGND